MSNNDIQLVDKITPSTETSNKMDEMDEWVVDIEGRLEHLDIFQAPRQSMDGDNSDSEEEPSIFGKWESWDDFGASCIPETHKWKYVACMTHWYGLNVKSFLKYMQGKVDLAWSYYHGVDEQFRTAENNKRFIEHLLASSCLLIFLIVYSSEGEYEKVITDKMDDQTSFPKSLTRKDIGNLFTIFEEDPEKYVLYTLNINYQIPWFVIEAVYTKLSNIGSLLDTPIHKLAVSLFEENLTARASKVDGGTVPRGGFKHLLHIFHWSRATDGKYLVYSTRVIRKFHIPTATELKLAQTAFVKDEGGFIDVSYSQNRRLSGVMQLTTWSFFKHFTKVVESVLIFEHMYEKCGIPFTAYVACMSCLLRREEDVRVLRQSGVIPSTTFDDKDILHYLQELKTFIPGNLRTPSELITLEEKVMEHYQRSAYRVYGEFKKRYCSNPWITLSVVGGILLFILTFIQTVLSFIQTKYSVLSYKHQ